MAMQELFLEIYLFLLCINGGIMVVDSITDTPLMTPFDATKHCFDANGLIIVSVVNNEIVETYTDETACTTALGTWAYQEVTAVNIPLIGGSDHCTINNQPNYSIADSAECATVSGTWVTVSGTLQNDVVSNVNAGAPVLSALTDAVFLPFAIIQGMINFLTGGFIWQTLALVGLPSIFVLVLQGVIGLLLIRTIIYYVLGR